MLASEYAGRHSASTPCALVWCETRILLVAMVRGLLVGVVGVVAAVTAAGVEAVVPVMAVVVGGAVMRVVEMPVASSSYNFRCPSASDYAS